jgi:hypothetical protein
LIKLMETMRSYILEGTFEARLPELLSLWQGNAKRHLPGKHQNPVTK